jgi:DNA-binding MarR family transcriptional regulator
MNFWDDQAQPQSPPSIEEIYASPGHLIRRSQQISVSLFAEELGQAGVTPVQYAALMAIRDRPTIDQRSLGRLIAIDRSTIGSVVKGLENKGYITRETPENNLRIKVLTLTDAGDSLLKETTEGIANVQRRLLAPLTPQERATFLHLISRLVEVNNEHSRAPHSPPQE